MSFNDIDISDLESEKPDIRLTTAETPEELKRRITILNGHLEKIKKIYWREYYKKPRKYDPTDFNYRITKIEGMLDNPE